MKKIFAIMMALLTGGVTMSVLGQVMTVLAARACEGCPGALTQN